MVTAIIMPKAGMSMEEGIVIKWFKAEGDQIEQGEPLLEILTDKVNMEVEAQISGVLLKITKQEGEVVPVTNVIGYIGNEGEQIAEALEVEAPKVKEAKEVESTVKVNKLQTVAGKVAATPAARRIAYEKGIDLTKVNGTGIYGEIKTKDVLEYRSMSATPLAKRIADANGIDLASVSGGGYDGKVMKQDVLSKLNVKAAAHLEPSVSQERKAGIPLKGIRKVISERMLKSHLEVPAVTLNAKADVSELAAVREKLNKAVNVKLTYNDFVLRAVALALKEHPEINASLIDNEIVYKEEINVGMAVATEGGLTVPVIKGVDNTSLKNISSESKELSTKARDGKLTLEDLSGGTFTVSNLGMYDILSFTPIINQPESAILGVCAIEDELKMVEGKVEARKIMGLSLTFDHRIIDGAVGAVFLKRIKTLLENPLEVIL